MEPTDPTNQSKDINSGIPDLPVPAPIQPPAPLLPYAGGASPMANVYQSPNYKPGSDGWFLGSNGDSEFNQDLNPPASYVPYLSQILNQYPLTSTDIVGGADDDTYVWIKDSGAGYFDLYRYKIVGGGFTIDSNGNTTNEKFLASTSYANSPSNMATLGLYIYTYAQKVAGSTNLLLRITKSDGTITEMTISGTSPSNNPDNIVTSDGTYLYIGDLGTTVWRKYSVSGTTATFVSTLTATTNNLLYAGCDGTFLYTAESSGANRYLRKYNLSGTVQKSEYASNAIINSPAYRAWFTQNSKFQAMRLAYVDSGTTSRRVYDIIPFIF